MPKLGLVYDLRLPGMLAHQRAGQYRTCLEQAAWADRVGIGRVSLREHHSSPDGYLPSPVTLAAGIAAVTSSLTILLQALVVTLYDPVRVAEDLAVLDLISAGRLAVMAGDGRPVMVTPLPFQPSGPPLLLGGASRAAARRAAVIADGYLPIRDQGHQDYRDAVMSLGRPGPGPLGKSAPFFVWVADDPGQAWRQIGPYCLHETNAYGALAGAAGLNTGFVPHDDLDAAAARTLWEIEQIKQLKARYSRFVDTRDWDGVISLLSPDCDLNSTLFPEARTREPPEGSHARLAHQRLRHAPAARRLVRRRTRFRQVRRGARRRREGRPTWRATNSG